MNPLNYQQREKRKQGFFGNEDGFLSVETIIVIIVVSVIIAGVVYGASKMYEKHRQNTAQSQIALIVQDFRSLYYGQSSAGTTDVTEGAISAGVIPQDMVSGNEAKNPWDGAVTLKGATADFILSYAAIPKKTCVDLVTKHSAVAQDLGLKSIHINETEKTDFPISPNAASAACTESNEIKWTFRLRG